MRLNSNVTLLEQEGKRFPAVFVDCIRMRGVLSAHYNHEGDGQRPTLTVTVIAPHLGHGKPRVRRKCGTRPHVPATGGPVRSVSVLAGERTSDVFRAEVAEMLRAVAGLRCPQRKE